MLPQWRQADDDEEAINPDEAATEFFNPCAMSPHASVRHGARVAVGVKFSGRRRRYDEAAPATSFVVGVILFLTTCLPSSLSSSSAPPPSPSDSTHHRYMLVPMASAAAGGRRTIALRRIAGLTFLRFCGPETFRPKSVDGARELDPAPDVSTLIVLSCVVLGKPGTQNHTCVGHTPSDRETCDPDVNLLDCLAVKAKPKNRDITKGRTKKTHGKNTHTQTPRRRL